MAPAGNYFLSCDWGTTSFRICLADRAVGEPLALHTAAEGIALTYANWKAQAPAGRVGFYLDVLRRQLRHLHASLSVPLEGLPLIISGMASSSIGMQELPYAGLPYSLNSAAGITRKLRISQDHVNNDITLVSGLRSDTDVMRGEETQLFGLAPSFPGDATFVFPGTHSKHIHVKDGYITGFETFMTGEFFSLLANHSILKDSIDPSETALNGSVRDAFHAGLRQAETGNLLHSAFFVRTNHLFDKISKAGNFHYLSGLLIGTELHNLKQKRIGAARQGTIVLCAGAVFSGFYNEALSAFGLDDIVHRVSARQVEQAALNGHRRLLQLL